MHYQHFVQKDACLTAYRHISHHPNRPTYVFLHGLGGDLAVWQPLVEYLDVTQHINSLSIDLRGHGLSSRLFPSQPPDTKFYTNDVVALINQLKLDKPVIIGHCFGGVIGLQVAPSLPVSAVVTINTFPQFRHQLQPRLFQFCIRGTAWALPSQPKTGHMLHHRHRHHRNYDIIRIYRDIRQTGIDSYCYALGSYAAFKLPPLRHATQIPLISILGTKDSITPFAKTESIFRHHFRAPIITAATNHLIPLNYPAPQLARLVAQALSLRGIHHFKA